jgi:hypothetical protein
MARTKKLENMSFAELAAMEARIEKVKIEKNAERDAVREKIIGLAKEHGALSSYWSSVSLQAGLPGNLCKAQASG